MENKVEENFKRYFRSKETLIRESDEKGRLYFKKYEKEGNNKIDLKGKICSAEKLLENYKDLMSMPDGPFRRDMNATERTFLDKKCGKFVDFFEFNLYSLNPLIVLKAKNAGSFYNHFVTGLYYRSLNEKESSYLVNFSEEQILKELGKSQNLFSKEIVLNGGNLRIPKSKRTHSSEDRRGRLFF